MLLALSVLRYGGDVLNRVSAAPSVEDASDVRAVLDSLDKRTRVAIEERERRNRPLAAGETLNPNHVDAVELDRLPGVGPSTAEAIVAARDSGVVFHRAMDMLEVRGIGPSTLERMALHLDFADVPRMRSATAAVERPSADRRHALPGIMLVDVNSADPQLLESLPGIGPALALRIVAERERRIFATLNDLARVRGIGSTTVRRLHGLAVARRIY